jgi:prepilin-type N-terminal cleavage/methylation domain-containing protein
LTKRTLILNPRRGQLSRDADIQDDPGFTLVELLVYVALLGIVLFILSGMLISGLNVQRTVTRASDETRLGQLISRSVEKGVRNATAFKVESVGADQILRARSADVKPPGGASDVTWRCMAWYFRASDGAFFATTRAAGAVSLPGTVSPATPLSAWTLYGSGVKPVSGASTVFSGSAPAFSASAPSLKLTFQVAVDNAPPVQIAAEYNLRVQNDTTTGPAACY